ncbi:BatB protein [Endozoicomonas sp. OPT23]|uniref:VWA domain-containing protein n=1 Tax=Endozoicomonas sp. OPT23 TaxID=2072845 RepID=UPI00129B88D3|nr:VWA domain-containing protein [Endozoicomonas sp. OPT23]MRI35258.1 BatB protein [Endozoicomonas sp. OPT23]
MLELQWPWILLALPLPWLVYRLATPAVRSGGAALQVPFYRELSSIAEESGHDQLLEKQQWRLVLPLLIWLCLLLAAARPTWLGEPVQVAGTGRDFMMAIDLSGSMAIDDLKLDGVAVDRLTAAKDILKDFIERRRGDRLGLILFGSNAYLQAPLTFDLTTVSTLMGEAEIGMAGKLTAIGDALGLAVKNLRERPQDNRVLVLMTDGSNTASTDPLQVAKLAADEHIRIYTIGLGADEMLQPGLFGAQRVNPSADLDEKTLKQIAEMTGGQYFRAKDTRQLEQIYGLLDQLEPAVQDEESYRPSKALFYWPLSIALMLSLLLALLKTRLMDTLRYKNTQGEHRS